MGALCKDCQAPIVWCETPSGKKMPVDAAPSERGNILMERGDKGMLGRIALPTDLPGPRHTSHFVTCPNAANRRRPRSGAGTLIVDIETIVDPELGTWPPEGKEPDAFPPPAWHRVVAIAALAWDKGPIALDLLGPSEDERAQLQAFAGYVDGGALLVTWNGRRFDLPVMAMRSLRHGVALPRYYGAKDYRYRYSTEGHFDVADFLTDFGGGSASGLGDVSRLCGLPGKLGALDGSRVGGYWAEGRVEEIRNYCLRDVVETAFVWLRAELLRGAMTPEQHHAAASRLWDFTAADGRVSPLLTGCDRARVTLAPSGAGQEAA